MPLSWKCICKFKLHFSASAVKYLCLETQYLRLMQTIAVDDLILCSYADTINIYKTAKALGDVLS